QSGRHIERAAFDIQAARDLDLLHLFACRYRDAENALDELVLLMLRVVEIEPDRVLRDFSECLRGVALKRAPMRNIDREHGRPPGDALWRFPLVLTHTRHGRASRLRRLARA